MVTHAQVSVFVPNLIGYGRFLLLFLCPVFVYSEQYWYWYTICYAASQLLDVVDGMAARKFDQCSRFGAALDMVCDRTSNALNFFILASVYPQVSSVFFICFILDFGSHFLQFQATALSKAASHKSDNDKANWLVKLYYTNYTIFATTVAGTEVGAVLLFINAKMPSLHSNVAWIILVGVFSLIMAFKMMVNVYQWIGGVERLFAYENQSKSAKEPAKGKRK